MAAHHESREIIHKHVRCSHLRQKNNLTRWCDNGTTARNFNLRTTLLGSGWLETIISIDNSDVLSVGRVQWLDVLIQRGYSLFVRNARSGISRCVNGVPFVLDFPQNKQNSKTEGEVRNKTCCVIRRLSRVRRCRLTNYRSICH